jgi:hypothetical protein
MHRLYLYCFKSVLPEDGEKIQSPKLCVLENIQDGVLDKHRTMENVQKHNICTNEWVFGGGMIRKFVPYATYRKTEAKY